jgi:hypothetical protein
VQFHIPYHYPKSFDTGLQIFNPGTGGPASHMGIQAMQPRIAPTIYAIGLPGLGAMPRQVIGPTLPITSNQLSRPDTVSHLQIRGLFKYPVGG